MLRLGSVYLQIIVNPVIDMKSAVEVSNYKITMQCRKI